jgi:hypothetical protein
MWRSKANMKTTMTSKSNAELIETAQQNCEALIKHLLSFNLNLVRFKGRKKFTEPCGLATGFLTTRGNRSYLLSAGHSMRRKSAWFWETNVVFQDERKTLCIPVGPFTLIKRIVIRPGGNPKTSNIDFAWCEFDVEQIRRRFNEATLLKARQLEIQFYNGPFDCVPILRDEPYTFAAWNRGTLISLGSLFLERQASYETCMTYTGKNSKGNYIFKLARPHMGHKFYKGSSGAPIAAPDGRIVSMVLGGNIRTNEIYGLPLAQYDNLLGLT